MKQQLLWLSSIAIVGGLAVAVAAENPSQNQSGRFTMSPAGDGAFIRLDTQTGVMALCKQDRSDWTCRAMPDATNKMNDEIASLKAENKQLKDEIQQMEETFGLNGPPAPGAGSGGAPAITPPGFKLPSEQDVDKALDYVERMIKKFRDRFRKLEQAERPEPETTPL